MWPMALVSERERERGRERKTNYISVPATWADAMHEMQCAK
jgi:hypothetical protein